MHTLPLLLALAVITTSLTACNTIKAPPAARTDPLAAQDYPQIVMLEGLDSYLAVSNVVQDPGPPMDVTVFARGLTNGEQPHVQYRFTFMDRQGRSLERDAAWHYMTVPSRTRVEFRANALDSRAVDWRLEVRPAR